MPYEMAPQQVKDWISKALPNARKVLFYDNPLPPFSGGDIIPGDFNASQEDIPAPVVEAVMALETGGTWDPATRTATGQGYDALGLGQVTLPGQEVAWWNAITDYQGDRVDGFPAGVTSEADLLDPVKNAELTAFGLGARYSAVRESTGKGNWLWAASAYFGCPPDKNGNIDPNCGDRLGTSGQGYAATVRDYIATNYGEDAAKEAENPKQPVGWINKLWEQTGGRALDAATGYTADVVRGVLSGLVGAVEAAAPRIGIAVAGIAFLGLGLFLATRSGQNGGA